MADPAIDAIRALPVARPRPSGLAELRARSMPRRAVSAVVGCPLEPVSFDGVSAEWR